jgi:arylsulfatase A-like enzyme
MLVTLVATTVPAAAAPVPSHTLAVRAPAGAPNVILIITDDQRAGTLSYMPQLRRRVSKPGIRFRSAYVPNPACCPSRASFYTGTYSHTNGVWKNTGPFGGFEAYDDHSTLATWLNGAGYRTGLFGKYLNGYHDPRIVPPGWDEWFAFIADDGRNYFGFDASHDGRLASFPESVYSTVETYERVSNFIRTTPSGRPVFAVWTPIAPHRPFLPEEQYADAPIDLTPWRPPNYNERDMSDKSDWLRRTDRLTARQRHTIDGERLAQYRTLLSVDDGIAAIVRALRQEGRLTNTLIVFASDNGLMWGEHRLSHKAVPYDGASRVPMVVRYDPLIGRARGGSSTGTPVVNIDVAPTVMDALGMPTGSPVDGESLVPLLDGSADRVRTRFIVEHASGGDAPAYCGARSRKELFIRYATGEEEYYRLDRDPWSLENLAGEPGWGAEVNALRSYARSHCSPVPPGFSW